MMPVLPTKIIKIHAQILWAIYLRAKHMCQYLNGNLFENEENTI